MNHTTPRASDDITVLRTRQLEATKRRVIAELRARDIVRATLHYRSEPFASGDVETKGIDAEKRDGTATVLEPHLENAFYDIATLVERFSLDLVAHFHSGFEIDGGNGYVLIEVQKGAVRIEHTDIQMNQVGSENTF